LVYNSNRNSRIKNKIKKDPLFVSHPDSEKTTLQCNVVGKTIVLDVIPNSTPKDLRLQNNSPAQAVLKAATMQVDMVGKIIQPNAPLNLGAYQ
jgi:molybdopterin-binding protein